eukprot:tig00020563_g11244.t1
MSAKVHASAKMSVKGSDAEGLASRASFGAGRPRQGTTVPTGTGAAAAGHGRILSRASVVVPQQPGGPGAEPAFKRFYDYDPAAAARARSQTNSAWHVFYKKIEGVVFSILFYLTDRTGKEPSLFSRFAVPYIFLLYDFTQLMTLSLPPGFPTDTVSWFSYAGNVESTLASMQPIGIFWLAVSLIVTTFVLTGFVFYMSLARLQLTPRAPPRPAPRRAAPQTQNLRVLPIKILRVLATALVDALFIPVTQILAQPFACFLAARASGPDGLVRASVLGAVPSCPAYDTGIAPVYFAVSTILLVTFVPYALVFALIFFDSCPVSSAVEARPHGRFSFLYVCVQATMIFVNFFVSADVATAHGINFALLISLWLFLFISSPFYSTFTTAFRGGLFLAAASFPLANRFIRSATDLDGAPL